MQILTDDSVAEPPPEKMSRDTIRFLAEVTSRPLSTTVSRYQRMHLSRRRGNAIRQQLLGAGVLEAMTIATRSGQVVLNQLTDHGRSVCADVGVDPGPAPRTSLEHSFWVTKAAKYFERLGYDLTWEYHIAGNGDVDLVAERPGERVAIEIETGKSDIKKNVGKVKKAGFDRLVLVATSPSAVAPCQRTIASAGLENDSTVELLTWLDVS